MAIGAFEAIQDCRFWYQFQSPSATSYL